MVTLRITADVPSNRQLLITLPPDVPLGKTELEIRVASRPEELRGVPGASVRGIAAGTGPTPGYDTIAGWLDERRVEKFG